MDPGHEVGIRKTLSQWMTSLVDLQTWKRLKSDNGDVTYPLLTVVLSLRPSYKLCGAIKNLGIDLAAAKVFKCSYDNAKRKFYRAFNAILGKIGRRRTASEEVIIQLLKSKCLPVLFYGLDVCRRQLF